MLTFCDASWLYIFVFRGDTLARLRFSSENEVSTRTMKNPLNNFPKIVERFLFNLTFEETENTPARCIFSCFCLSQWKSKKLKTRSVKQEFNQKVNFDVCHTTPWWWHMIKVLFSTSFQATEVTETYCIHFIIFWSMVVGPPVDKISLKSVRRFLNKTTVLVDNFVYLPSVEGFLMIHVLKTL